MTALTLVATPDPTGVCPECQGAGEIGDGTRDSNGIYGTQDCPTCNGSGCVAEEAVVQCHDGCQEWFWADEMGCTHHMTLCLGCSGRCIDCVVEARAEAGFAALRDAVVMAGAR